MNRLNKDDIKNIYRIEFMPSSNWDMGLNRKIWILEIEGDEVLRSLYVGDLLIPKYTYFANERDKKLYEEFVSEIKNGNIHFRNSFESYEIIEELENRKIWEWNEINNGLTIDGTNYDIAFYTKDEKGNNKIFRYQFWKESLKENDEELFNRLFDTVIIEDLEIVRMDEEMGMKTSKLLPGGNIQEME